MDLRKKSITPAQMSRLRNCFVTRQLAYQPFIFSDDLEAGAGEHFINGLPNLTIHWSDPDPRLADIVTANVDHFRRSNACLRAIYEHFLDSITREVGEVSSLQCAEIGCNSGYFLFGLALRGARRCIGYDCSPNSEFFAVMNEVLGTRCEFHLGEWDSLDHRLNHAVMSPVDLCLSVAVTCHLSDPIQHLAYLCDHSRKAVFVYSPATDSDDLSITYARPGKYYKNSTWPVSLDNNVRLSVPLLRLCLEQAGFHDIREVQAPDQLPEEWKRWYNHQRGFVALRTEDVRTVLTPGYGLRTRMPRPLGLPRSTARRVKTTLTRSLRWWRELLSRAWAPST